MDVTHLEDVLVFILLGSKKIKRVAGQWWVYILLQTSQSENTMSEQPNNWLKENDWSVFLSTNPPCEQLLNARSGHSLE